MGALELIGCAGHARASAYEPPVGSVAVLGLGASHGEEVGVPCVPTRAALDAALRGRADDAIPLAPRLRVRILARDARDVRVRVLDGPWADTTCWVDGTLDDLFARG